jgi:uncharacterized repeat protein (TIGR01451 family)
MKTFMMTGRRRSVGGTSRTKVGQRWGPLLAAAAVLLSAPAAFSQGIVTDKASYLPGETVTITGNGWQPQEQVSLVIGNTEGSRTPATMEATADGIGSFRNQGLLVEETDRNQMLTLGVRGSSGAETMMGVRVGAAPGSLRCSTAAADSNHFGIAPGQKVTCTIEGATDLSAEQQSGAAPVEVLVRSRLLGNERAQVISVTGTTITFEYTAAANAAGASLVSYGPIKVCDRASGKCGTFPTGGNDSNAQALSGSGTAAGFAYLADSSAPSCIPFFKIVSSPSNGAFTQGSQASYTIVVSNPAAAGSNSATNVQLTDELPGNGGLIWQTATTTQGSCSIVNNVLSCSLGDIGPQAAVIVTVLSTATTPVVACQYQPNVNAVATADGGLTVKASGALTCTPLPQLKVEQTPENGTFAQGEPVTFTVTVTNTAPPGAGAARNVILTDQLPGNGGLTWTYASGSQGDCSVENNYVTCALHDIAPGASVTVVMKTPYWTPVPACQPQQSIAAVTADGGLRAEDAGSVTCTPLPPTQLAVVESPHNGTFSQGGQATFTIVVSNPAPAGALPAMYVKLRDQLPTYGGLSWSSAKTTRGTCWLSSNYLTCSLGNIPAGGAVTVTVSTPATTSPLACVAQPKSAAVATAEGGLIAQDAGSLGCTPSVPTELAVEKTPDDGTLVSGGQLVFTYMVRNVSGLGAAPATNVQLTDQLPSPGGLVWYNAASDSGTCSITNNRLSCNLGTMATGASIKVVAWQKAVPPASCTTLGSMATITADGGITAQDSGSATCIGSAGPAGPTKKVCSIPQVSISNVSWNKFALPATPDPVVWVHAHLGAPSGIPAGRTTVLFTAVTLLLDGKPYPLPDGLVTFDPSASATVTKYNAVHKRWETTVNTDKLSNEIFFSGGAIPVDAAIAAGAKATITYKITTEATDLSFSWQWSAAVYSSWPADWNMAGITPDHGSYHAGAPQERSVQDLLLPGPRGGGGSNFTGSWSSTGDGSCSGNVIDTIEVPGDSSA